MKRIYCDKICEPSNEATNKHFVRLNNTENEAKDNLSDEDFEDFLSNFHNWIRQDLNLPNKIFLFARTKDNESVHILFFPKEPDGKCYKPEIDNESGSVYILVDDVEDN